MAMLKVFAAAAAVAVTAGEKLPHEVLPAKLEDEARYHLYAAYGAYCGIRKLEAWDCKWCSKMGPAKVYGVERKEGYDGQAFVIRNNASQIFVSFRGSSNIENWIQDFNFTKLTLPWGGVPEKAEVHKGFYGSYMALRTNILSWVTEAKKDCPTCTLHVTGHSLGAAEAALCTVDLRLQGMDPYMWTFGQPRVGNRVFSEFFAEKTTHPVYRMVNMKDTVPHVPIVEQGFHHTQREVWRMTNGTYMMCDNLGEDPKCSKSIPLPETSAADHTTYMGINEQC